MGRTKVRIKKIDSSVEKQIVTGMVVSSRFLRGIQPIFRPELMKIPFARTVAGWCNSYYSQYGKAPRSHIQDVYNSHARKENADEQTLSLVEDFLSSLSEEHEDTPKFNVDYVLDQAEKLFDSRALKAMAEDVETALANGDQEAARLARESYKPIARPVSQGIDPFTDEDSIREAFEEQDEPLFTFPGALGYMMNEHLTRETLIGLMGHEKKGKSWWLEELARRAARARCNVAYFQVGDMSRKQVQRRFHVSLAKRSNLRRYCGEMLIPVLDCEHNQEDTCRMNNRACSCGVRDDEDNGTSPRDLFRHAPSKYRPCTYCYRNKKKKFKGAIWYEKREEVKPLTWREGLKLGRKFANRYRGRKFKLIAVPTINVVGIRTQLEMWKTEEGFLPDVIVIDYADNMEPEPEDRRKDTRDQQNGTWKALSELRLEWKCLVASATQADAKAFDAKVLKMANFSEDKRKYGHVTAMWGLNQTPDEKAIGIMRVNPIVIREGSFSSLSQVKVIQCLEQGRPCIASYR
jgi:hypothetical protein